MRTYGTHNHHDDVKWKDVPYFWPFDWGIHRSPVNSPHKAQWREALMYSLICAWTNAWVNNRVICDFGRHRAHYDITVMISTCKKTCSGVHMHQKEKILSCYKSAFAQETAWRQTLYEPQVIHQIVPHMSYQTVSYLMMTSSNRSIFLVTGHLSWEFPGHRWIPHTKPITGSFDVSLICAWINGWVNNHEVDDLRRHEAHYDVIAMMLSI